MTGDPQAKLSGAEHSPRSPSAIQQTPNFPYNITVKATMGEETRLLHVSIMVSYAELYEAIKGKFPGTGEGIGMLMWAQNVVPWCWTLEIGVPSL